MRRMVEQKEYRGRERSSQIHAFFLVKLRSKYVRIFMYTYTHTHRNTKEHYCGEVGNQRGQ